MSARPPSVTPSPLAGVPPVPPGTAINGALNNTNTQAPEATLAEACQLGSQREAEEQEKRTRLEKQTPAEETRASDGARDAVGRKVRERRTPLTSLFRKTRHKNDDGHQDRSRSHALIRCLLAAG